MWKYLCRCPFSAPVSVSLLCSLLFILNKTEICVVLGISDYKTGKVDVQGACQWSPYTTCHRVPSAGEPNISQTWHSIPPLPLSRDPWPCKVQGAHYSGNPTAHNFAQSLQSLV